MRCCRFSLVLVAAGAAFAGTAQGQESIARAWQDVQPHRVVLSMREWTTNPAPKPAEALVGEMIREFRLSCDGLESWTSISLRPRAADPPAHLVSEVRTFESRDGTAYRYSARVVEDGKEVEKYVGEAKLAGYGAAGVARIAAPAPRELSLSAGTVFPATHAMRLIAAAREGKREIESLVFYGYDKRVVARVRSRVKGEGRAGQDTELGMFAGRPGWSVYQEYREAGSMLDPLTMHDFFITADGFIPYMKLNDEGLVFFAGVKSVEVLPRPDCKR